MSFPDIIFETSGHEHTTSSIVYGVRFTRGLAVVGFTRLFQAQYDLMCVGRVGRETCSRSSRVSCVRRMTIQCDARADAYSTRLLFKCRRARLANLLPPTHTFPLHNILERNHSFLSPKMPLSLWDKATVVANKRSLVEEFRALNLFSTSLQIAYCCIALLRPNSHYVQ